MDPETIIEAGRQAQYFRTPEFSRMLLDCNEMLLELLDAPEHTRLLFLTASGTGAMEAAVINLFTPADKLLVVNGGTFGRRFKQICDIHRIPAATIDLAWDQAFQPEMLSAYENAGFTGMLVNQCETSTGQLYPMEAITAFCQRNRLCLVVDAISSFLCDSVKMKALGASAVIVSSQKGLALHPGMSFVAVTEEAFETRCAKHPPESLYFRFTDYAADMERGQTPFTPAVGIVNQLYYKLERLTQEGVWQQIYHIATLASYFREQLPAKTNFTIPRYPLSNCVTPVFCKDNNAVPIFEFLKDSHDVYVTPCGGELKSFLFRVAHMSRQITTADLDELLRLLRLV
jgi:aspartate aminotransferase-like enzyme